MNPAPHILEGSESALEECAELLRRDQLVAVPTETVYGLAGNALSECAVRKIFEVKGRPLIDPLITHFKDASTAFSYVHANAAAEKLASHFWPGPLTMVLEKLPIMPDLVTAGLKSAAIRVPRQPLMRALLQKLDLPLAAPSANPFGYVSPTRPEHVASTLGTKIAAILDGGICEHGLESTVLDLRFPDRPTILRPGPICSSEIESMLGCSVHKAEATGQNTAQTSPGQLSKHYSPSTKIRIVEHGRTDISLSEGEALVTNRKPTTIRSEHVYWLSEDGNPADMSRSLFDLLQKLDRMNYESLIIEAVPEEGLGIAINDRLRRAAAS